MTPRDLSKLDVTREQVRSLEDAVVSVIDGAADADPQALAVYLEPLAGELRSARARLDETLGIEPALAGAASIWLKFRGGAVGEGRAPAHVVGRALEALQRGTRQAAFYVEMGVTDLRRVGRDALQAAELDVLAFATGSLQVGVAPRIEQLSLVEEGLLAERGLTVLLDTARWAEARGEDEELDAILPAPQLRRQLLNRVRDLAPSSVGEYATLEFEGRLVAGSGRGAVRLTGVGHAHAAGYLRRREREEISLSGRLVMMDVEKDILHLRVGPRRIRCLFPEDVKELAKSLLEEYVEVTGLGLFDPEDEEYPWRIDVLRVRRLRPEEQARL